MSVVLVVLVILRDFRGRTLVVRFVLVGLVFFFFTLFFKNRPARSCVRLHFLANLILFCFDHAGREDGGFFVANFRVLARILGVIRIAVEVLLFGFVFRGGSGAYLFRFLADLFSAFGWRAPEQPTGPAA